MSLLKKIAFGGITIGSAVTSIGGGYLVLQPSPLIQEKNEIRRELYKLDHETNTRVDAPRADKMRLHERKTQIEQDPQYKSDVRQKYVGMGMALGAAFTLLIGLGSWVKVIGPPKPYSHNL